MSYEARCAVCGRKYWQESSGLAKFTGVSGAAEDLSNAAFLGAGVKLLRAGAKAASGKKDICPDCRRQGHSENSVGGGGSGYSSEDADRAESKRKAAVHKEAIRDVKNYEFPEDDREFNRAVNNFCDDYCECSGGLMADRDYKKTYKQRAERELKFLKDSNPAHFDKFNELWEEASATMKKKLKIRLIISGVIIGVFVIGGGILMAADNENFFVGALIGLCFGGTVSILPHMSRGFGKTKTDNE